MVSVIFVIITFWLFVALAAFGVSIIRKFVKSDFYDVWSDDD
jgi:hypothetical protein